MEKNISDVTNKETKEIECVYVVRAIYVDEITEEKNKKEYEIYKLKYPGWKEKTYEDFLEFQKGWKKDKWDIGGFDSSYHMTKEEAIEYATKNIGDINEAGCYMYAAVCPLPLGVAYYNTDIDRNEILLFKYCNEKDEYEPLNIEEEGMEKESRIRNYVWGFI